jgi:hypothetical protein
MVTTRLAMADGIGGPGQSPPEGHTRLTAARERVDRVKPGFSSYGCHRDCGIVIKSRTSKC